MYDYYVEAAQSPYKDFIPKLTGRFPTRELSLYSIVYVVEMTTEIMNRIPYSTYRALGRAIADRRAALRVVGLPPAPSLPLRENGRPLPATGQRRPAPPPPWRF